MRIAIVTAILAFGTLAHGQAPIVPAEALTIPVRPKAEAEHAWSGPPKKPKVERSFWETVPPVQPQDGRDAGRRPRSERTLGAIYFQVVSIGNGVQRTW